MLVRARDDDGARERLSGRARAPLRRADLRPPARVRAVRGDLLEPGLGLSARDREWLIGSVDRIVHCAASISFELPLEQAREINVEGVARVLELAREIAAGGALRRMVHVSTAYVSGRHAGEFGEEDLDVGQEFRNTYERSKHEAERLLRGADDLPLAIARPSIVVGHRVSGWTPAFNVLYWPMRAFERGLLEEVPAREDSIVDFVPVDYVTDGIVALLDDERRSGHIQPRRRRARAERRRARAAALSLSGREPVRFVAAGRRRRRAAGGSRERSCRTSTCAAGSATSARRAARACRRGAARSEGLPGAADRVRARGRVGQARDVAAGDFLDDRWRRVETRRRTYGRRGSEEFFSRECCIAIVIRRLKNDL